jgi:hypothetical protein
LPAENHYISQSNNDSSALPVKKQYLASRKPVDINQTMIAVHGQSKEAI